VECRQLFYVSDTTGEASSKNATAPKLKAAATAPMASVCKAPIKACFGRKCISINLTNDNVFIFDYIARKTNLGVLRNYFYSKISSTTTPKKEEGEYMYFCFVY
jgi:hypothetical protein